MLSAFHEQDTMSLPITIDTYSLRDVERTICDQALSTTGSIVEAAKILGITRHALKRRIVKLNIQWPRKSGEAA